MNLSRPLILYVGIATTYFLYKPIVYWPGICVFGYFSWIAHHIGILIITVFPLGFKKILLSPWSKSRSLGITLKAWKSIIECLWPCGRGPKGSLPGVDQVTIGINSKHMTQTCSFKYTSWVFSWKYRSRSLKRYLTPLAIATGYGDILKTMSIKLSMRYIKNCLALMSSMNWSWGATSQHWLPVGLFCLLEDF